MQGLPRHHRGAVEQCHLRDDEEGVVVQSVNCSGLAVLTKIEVKAMGTLEPDADNVLLTLRAEMVVGPLI